MGCCLAVIIVVGDECLVWCQVDRDSWAYRQYEIPGRVFRWIVRLSNGSLKDT